jgi:hypothetical protein
VFFNFININSALATSTLHAFYPILTTIVNKTCWYIFVAGFPLFFLLIHLLFSLLLFCWILLWPIRQITIGLKIMELILTNTKLLQKPSAKHIGSLPLSAWL